MKYNTDLSKETRSMKYGPNFAEDPCHDDPTGLGFWLNTIYVHIYNKICCTDHLHEEYHLSINASVKRSLCFIFQSNEPLYKNHLFIKLILQITYARDWLTHYFVRALGRKFIYHMNIPRITENENLICETCQQSTMTMDDIYTTCQKVLGNGLWLHINHKF